VNSKNVEDWEKNFTLLNDILSKIKSFKRIDPSKLCMCKFTTNFEFLQFSYDLIIKNFGNDASMNDAEKQHGNYKAFEKRLEILKIQNGSKIKKYK